MKTAWIQIGLANVGDMLSLFLGGADCFIYVLIVCATVDCIMGVLCAIVERKISIQFALHDIIKKVAIFLIVGLAHIIELHLFDNHNIIRTAIIIYYILSLALSILKKTDTIGVPFPKKLKEILLKLLDEA